MSFILFAPNAEPYETDAFESTPSGTYMYSRFTTRWYKFRLAGNELGQQRVVPEDVPKEILTQLLLLT